VAACRVFVRASYAVQCEMSMDVRRMLYGLRLAHDAHTNTRRAATAPKLT